ncbi:transglycosylase domain-containing protein [Pasteuria penetrans]|uniref:transglycosylase domain-containing protein n=1 Tax=Pasteuria penetrans TaxID=86005 RepID=UPI000F9FBD5F|nr:transglycosylase domain-containing protein [Pasteuria penetrans]
MSSLPARPREITSEPPTISPRKKNRFLRVLFYFFISLFVIGSSITGIFIGMIIASIKDEEILDREELLQNLTNRPQTSFVYSDHDPKKPLGTMTSPQVRTSLTRNQIPYMAVMALIAKEDSGFFTHWGASPKAILRACFEYIMAGFEKRSGGSTLTQQLVKFAIRDKNYSYEKRDVKTKIIEIMTSFKLEREFTKDEILTAYFNNVPMGSNRNRKQIRGFAEAANNFFGKSDLNDLNLAQTAYLVAMVQSPNRYSPLHCSGKNTNVCLEEGKKKQKIVLDRLLKHRNITEQQYQEALDFDLASSILTQSPYPAQTEPLLMQAIQNEAGRILMKTGKYHCNTGKECEKKAAEGGFKIYTSVHPETQRVTEEIAKQMPFNRKKYKDKTYRELLSATILDNRTGQIVAAINGHDHENIQYNYAFQRRQNGSVNKIIAAYAPAIQEGKISEHQTVNDTIIYKNDGTPYRNYDGRYLGPMSLAAAVAQSRNTIPIQLARSIGIGIMKKYLGRLGIPPDDREGEAVALGGYYTGVTTAQTAAAYATAVGPKGCYQEPHLIRLIMDGKNNIVFNNQESNRTCEPVFNEKTRGIMVRLMRGVITSGTARTIGQRFPQDYLFGKTGTSNDDQNHYLVICTKDYTIAIWMGYEMNALSSKGSLKTKDYFNKIYPEIKRTLNIDATAPDFALQGSPPPPHSAPVVSTGDPSIENPSSMPPPPIRREFPPTQNISPREITIPPYKGKTRGMTRPPHGPSSSDDGGPGINGMGDEFVDAVGNPPSNRMNRTGSPGGRIRENGIPPHRHEIGGEPTIP